MFSSAFRRMVWKEFRMQWAFGLSIIALSALMQLLLILGSALGNASRSDTGETFSAILALTCGFLYAVGCAGTLFSAERENDTFDFQQALPIRPLEIFAAKTAYAFVSTIFVSAASFLICFVFALGRPNGLTPFASVSPGLIYTSLLLALAWGIFFSLRSNRPLAACLLTAAVASSCLHAAAMLPGTSNGPNLADYERTAPIGLGIFAVVMALNVRRAMGRMPSDRRNKAPRVPKPSSNAAPNATARAAAPPRKASALTTFGRLVWLQWQHAKQPLAVIALLTIAGLVITTTSIGAASLNWAAFTVAFLIFTMPWVAALLGSCVFLGDQQGRSYLFAADRGMRPTMLWCSRQLVYGIALLALIIPGLLVIQSITVTTYYHGFSYGQLIDAVLDAVQAALRIALRPGNLVASLAFQKVTWLLAFVLIPYAAGQLCSMLCRSALLAATFGLMLAGALFGWCLFVFYVELPVAGFIAPIPVVLLFATWLRTSPWILENRTRRSRLRLLATTLGPAVVMLAVIPWYQTHALPAVAEADMWIAQPPHVPTPEDLQLTEAYRELRNTAPTDDPSRLYQLTNRPGTVWVDPRKPEQFDDANRDFTGSFFLIRMALDKHLQAGNLDAAADTCRAGIRLVYQYRHATPFATSYYRKELSEFIIRWAGHPNQTFARLQAMQKTVEEQTPILRDDNLQPLLFERYCEAFAIIDGTWTTCFDGVPAPQYPTLHLLAVRLLPWERTRAHRLLEQQVQTVRLRSDTTPPFQTGDLPSLHIHMANGPRAALLVPYWLPDPRRSDYSFYDYIPSTPLLYARHRTAVLALAIHAWRVEHHGNYPASLSDLTERQLGKAGRWNPQVPPYYLPRGLAYPLEIAVGPGYVAGDMVLTIPAGTPLLMHQDQQALRIDRNGPKKFSYTPDRFNQAPVPLTLLYPQRRPVPQTTSINSDAPGGDASGRTPPEPIPASEEGSGGKAGDLDTSTLPRPSSPAATPPRETAEAATSAPKKPANASKTPSQDAPKQDAKPKDATKKEPPPDDAAKKTPDEEVKPAKP